MPGPWSQPRERSRRIAPARGGHALGRHRLGRPGESNRRGLSGPRSGARRSRVARATGAGARGVLAHLPAAGAVVPGRADPALRPAPGVEALARPRLPAGPLHLNGCGERVAGTARGRATCGGRARYDGASRDRPVFPARSLPRSLGACASVRGVGARRARCPARPRRTRRVTIGRSMARRTARERASHGGASPAVPVSGGFGAVAPGCGVRRPCAGSPSRPRARTPLGHDAASGAATAEAAETASKRIGLRPLVRIRTSEAGRAPLTCLYRGAHTCVSWYARAPRRETDRYGVRLAPAAPDGRVYG